MGVWHKHWKRWHTTSGSVVTIAGALLAAGCGGRAANDDGTVHLGTGPEAGTTQGTSGGSLTTGSSTTGSGAPSAGGSGVTGGASTGSGGGTGSAGGSGTGGAGAENSGTEQPEAGPKCTPGANCGGVDCIFPREDSCQSCGSIVWSESCECRPTGGTCFHPDCSDPTPGGEGDYCGSYWWCNRGCGAGLACALAPRKADAGPNYGLNWLQTCQTVVPDGGAYIDAPYESDSAVCRSYVDVSAEVQGMIEARDLQPPVTGGRLLEGTYTLQGIQLFNGPSADGRPQPTVLSPALERGTLVIHDHALTFIGAQGTIESRLGPVSQETYLVEVDETSHELILTGVCGTSAQQRVLYSADVDPVGIPYIYLFDASPDGGLSHQMHLYQRR